MAVLNKMKELKQLDLLMWKHFHLRKHRWFITLVEIFLPIALGYLFCSQAAKISGQSTPHNATYEANHSPANIMSLSSHYGLLYAPKNNFTDQLMNRVEALASELFKFIPILALRIL